MYVIGVALLASIFVAGLVFAKLARFRKVGVLFLVLSVGFAISRIAVEHTWERKFASIPSGATVEEVRRSIYWETFEFKDGKSPLGYSLRDHDTRVTDEIWCVEFFVPGQYAFGFDASGKLVDRYHYLSP